MADPGDPLTGALAVSNRPARITFRQPSPSWISPMRSLASGILLGVIACASPSPQAGVPPVPVTDSASARYIGRLARVEGTVAQVKDHAHHGFAYLNFGRAHPDESFAVLIPDSVVTRFGDLTRFEGHRARATGTLWLQDGKYPAMTLTDPATLELLP